MTHPEQQTTYESLGLTRDQLITALILFIDQYGDDTPKDADQDEHMLQCFEGAVAAVQEG